VYIFRNVDMCEVCVHVCVVHVCVLVYQKVNATKLNNARRSSMRVMFGQPCKSSKLL
jgi:hypothetical protein